MRRATLSLTLLALLVAGASRAGAGGFDLRIGGYFPRGNETLFQDVPRSLLSSGKSDFNGVYGGIEYNHMLMDNVEFAVHLDGYCRTVDTSYRDYTRPDDSEIEQSLSLPHGPARRLAAVRADEQEDEASPRSSGAGVDADLLQVRGVRRLHRLRRSDSLPITRPTRSSRTAPRSAFHVLGRPPVYLNRDFAIVAEGRYQWAKDDMGDDFAPNAPGLVNTIDLSGATVHGRGACQVLTHLRELRDGRPGRSRSLADLTIPFVQLPLAVGLP